MQDQGREEPIEVVVLYSPGAGQMGGEPQPSEHPSCQHIKWLPD